MHPEERVWGNEFVVHVTVSKSTEESVTELYQTIDYAAIHALVVNQMKYPKPLLEEVAELILRDILIDFPELEKVQVRIQKMNPPLGGRVGSSEICLEKSR